MTVPAKLFLKAGSSITNNLKQSPVDLSHDADVVVSGLVYSTVQFVGVYCTVTLLLNRCLFNFNVVASPDVYVALSLIVFYKNNLFCL